MYVMVVGDRTRYEVLLRGLITRPEIDLARRKPLETMCRTLNLNKLFKS